MGVVVEDSGTTSVTYVLLKLDADFPSKLCVCLDNSRVSFLLTPTFALFSFGLNVVAKLPLPKNTSGCGYELGTSGHKFQYKKEENVSWEMVFWQCLQFSYLFPLSSALRLQVAIWTIPRISGGSSCYVRLRLSIPEEDKPKVKHEIGPIRLV